MCNFDTLTKRIMNWNKANKVLSGIDRLFNIFQKTIGVPPLISITNTNYKIESISVYSML